MCGCFIYHHPCRQQQHQNHTALHINSARLSFLLLLTMMRRRAAAAQSAGEFDREIVPTVSRIKVQLHASPAGRVHVMVEGREPNKQRESAV